MPKYFSLPRFDIGMSVDTRVVVVHLDRTSPWPRPTWKRRKSDVACAAAPWLDLVAEAQHGSRLEPRRLK